MEMKDFNRRRKYTVDKFNNTPPFNVKQFVDDETGFKISLNPSQNFGSYELESKDSLNPMKLVQIKGTMKHSKKPLERHLVKENRLSDTTFTQGKSDEQITSENHKKPENLNLLEKLLTPIHVNKCIKSKSAPKIMSNPYEKVLPLIKSDTDTQNKSTEQPNYVHQQNQKYSGNFENTPKFNKHLRGDCNEDYIDSSALDHINLGDEMITNLEQLQEICSINLLDDAIFSEQICNVDFGGKTDESVRKAIFKEKLNRILARKLYQIKYRERIIKELDITANYCQNIVKMPSNNSDTFFKDLKKDVKFLSRNIKMNQNNKFEKYMKLAQEVGDTKFVNNETFTKKNMENHEIVKNTLKSFQFEEHFPDFNQNEYYNPQGQMNDLNYQTTCYQEDLEENNAENEPEMENTPTQCINNQSGYCQNAYNGCHHYCGDCPTNAYPDSEESNIVEPNEDYFDNNTNDCYESHNAPEVFRIPHEYSQVKPTSQDVQQNQGTSKNVPVKKPNKSEINIPKNFVKKQIEMYNKQIKTPKINNAYQQKQLTRSKRHMSIINEGCKSTVENIRHHCCRNHNVFNSMRTNISEHEPDQVDSEGDGDTWNDGADSTPRVTFPKETRNAVAMMMNSRCHHYGHHRNETSPLEQSNHLYAEREPKVIPHLAGKLKISSMPCPRNLLCEKGVHEGNCNVTTKKCWPGMATRINQDHNTDYT